MNSTKPFDQFGLPAPLLRTLRSMGFETATPVQTAVLPFALEGKDILATAQTGTGKTAAFAVPMVVHLGKNRQDQALILAPTRELAAQIFGVLKKMCQGFPCRGALVVGGESFGRQVGDLERNPQVIVATPGRMMDHVREGTADLRKVKMLVLDEVDRMLDMGFAAQLREVMSQVPKERQTLLFSATLPQEIQAIAARYLRNPERIAIGTTTAATSQVKEETINTSADRKNEVLMEQLEAREGKVLVFTRTKHRTDRLARILEDRGHGVVTLHGGRSQAQRKRALERFQSGNRRIMIATDLAGRGIDVPDIEHVINYDLPATREEYIHRIGRTGRAGRTGVAVNFLTNEDTDFSKPKGAGGSGNGRKRFGAPEQRKPFGGPRRRGGFAARTGPASGGGRSSEAHWGPARRANNGTSERGPGFPPRAGNTGGYRNNQGEGRPAAAAPWGPARRGPSSTDRNGGSPRRFIQH